MTTLSPVEILSPATHNEAAPHNAIYQHRPRAAERMRFALTDEQLASYHDNGFVVLRNVFTQDEIDRLRDLQLAAFEQYPELLDPNNMRFEWVEYEGKTVPWKIDPFSDLHPVFGDLLKDRRICDPLCSIYDGYEPRIFKEKYIIKPPGSHGNGIHQDHNWWQGFPESCLSVAIAIDPADKQNGCTQFWPGSHKHGFLHEPGTLSGQIDRSYTADEPFYLETQPGDIAIFSCFTIHASGCNESDRFRRQIFLSYNDARDGEHYFAHREHFFNYRVHTYGDRMDVSKLYFV